MPFSDLQKLVAKFYGAPLSLRKLLPEETRKIYYKNILLATAFVFALSLVSMTIQNMPATNTLGISFFETAGNRIFGIFLILLSISFVFSALEAFHRSYYFKGLGEVLSENSQTDKETVTWEVATVLFETNPKDISGSFANSTYGQEILYRAGVSEKAFAEYENERTPTLTSDGFIVEKDGAVTLSTYAKSIYKQDSEFRNFLSKSNINKDQFIKSAQWVTSIERKERRASRWWSKDNLGRIPGVGKTWDYGVTYYLDRYGHDIINDHIWQTALMTHREEDDEVEELEKILSRNRQSNAMLLTNDVLTARQRVAQLYHKIREGMSLPQIEAKRVFLLDVESIIMSTNEKTNFEKAFVATLNQAVNAGNIILYIENVSVATASAKTIGTDVIDLIQPYFESSDIQIVFAETVKNYNKHLSRDTRISQAFDFIQMKDVEEDGLLKLLEQRSVLHEKMTGIVFTIPALEKIIELADRYFPTGTMPDKAFDLLEEMATNAVVDNKEQILQKDIEEFVTKKTHVPVGEPSEEEKTKLLSLEDFLHKRVIAQNDAINAISKSLRRARSGIANPNKPMGTFLFLGPTGVGKTETAKALAEVLFGNEKNMLRIDMSEFQSEDAIEELIGDFETGAPGRLDTLVRKQQYGVLLLDEFEKSNKDVHDLFLQILDEGFFTDSTGEKVNMKNLIIIATSNAGANLIWEWEKENKNIQKSKKILVDYIIEKSLFKPELLNRFDEIIVFHPLQMEHVKKIAEIHIKNLAKRLNEKQNIKIKITDDLVNYIAQKGYDPQFGGRPLERAIMEEIEQKIADEILAGNLHSGDIYTFNKKDFS